MSSSRNGSGSDAVESGHSGSIGDIVDSSCKKVVKEIVKEINENVVFMYDQLFGIGKDMELL